jgi:hypothetical protein
MQIRFGTFMRRVLTGAVLVLPLASTHAFAADPDAGGSANPTASGSLAVTATVASSLTLTIGTATGGVTLTGAGTNAATLPFGTISAYGTQPTNVTVSNSGSLCSNCFIASTPVSIAVIQADGTSGSYTLTAQLANSTGSYAWGVGSSPALNNSSATTVTGSATYGASGNTFRIQLGVPTSTANATAISNTINFVATAN